MRFWIVVLLVLIAGGVASKFAFAVLLRMLELPPPILVCPPKTVLKSV